MAKNLYFDSYNFSNEQETLEGLIIESIQIYGEEMWYIPRKLNNYDPLLGADDQSSYENAYLLEMYIKSVDGFTGDGTFLSKFGLEIKDQVTFSVAQRRFTEEVGEPQNQSRPNEGDLVYFPLNQKCFQIKYVNKFEMFYPLGKLYTWELTCELFEYSKENINTGIAEIDSIATNYSLNALDYTLLTEDGNNYLTTEDNDILELETSTISSLPGDDTIPIQREASTFIDFSIKDPFSEGDIIPDPFGS